MTSKNCVVLSLLFFVVSLFHIDCVSAEWNPEEVLSNYDVEVIQDPDFLKLKQDVSSYLTGSWCSEEKTNVLMDIVCATRSLNCVEVGVFTGFSVLPVAATLQYLKNGRVYAIDAWSASEVVRDLDPSDPNTVWWSKVDMGAVRRKFYDMLQTWNVKDRCSVVATPSAKAVSILREQLDFLHLDGGFSEKSSSTDVALFLPKVRSRGYILLSNVFFTSNGQYLKKKAFRTLYDCCDVVCVIDRGESILFQKR